MLAVERRRGEQNPLAAAQGETVPTAAPLRGAGQSVPCGPPRNLAGENPGSGQLAGSPWPQDGLWTVVEQLEWRDMSVPLDEHRLRASQGVRELRRWLPGSSFVLSGGREGVRLHSIF
jgi:hypothetical protein